MTAAFTPAFEASLKGDPQGGVLRVSAGHVVSPQFFCCITGTDTGVNKMPVAQIRGDVQDVCPNSPICIDISGSWSPTSTIASWSVDWDDGNVSNGAWPPPASVCHPLGGYALTGVYDVTLTVTDLLGETDDDIMEVVVYDCPPDPPPPLAVACGTNGGGVVWTNNFSDPVPTWSLLDITHLNVPGARVCRCIKEHVGSDGLRRLIMGSDCGIHLFECWPPGGEVGPDIWRRTVDSIYDLCLPLSLLHVNYTTYAVEMAPDNPDYGYALWGTDHTGGNFKKLCIAHTRDGWQSVHSTYVIITQFYANLKKAALGIEPHSMGKNVWVVHPNYNVWRSTNYGASWASMDNTLGDNEGAVFIPWYALDHDDLDVFHAENANFERSTNGGLSWSNIVNTNRCWWLAGSNISNELVNISGKTYLQEWDPSGGLVTLATYAIADWMWDGRVTLRNADGTLQEAIICGGTTGATARIYEFERGVGSTDKTSNITALIGTGVSILSINREAYSGVELLP